MLLLWVVPISLVVGSLLSVQFFAAQGSVPLSSADEKAAELVMFAVSGVISALLAAGLAVLGFRLRAERVHSELPGGMAAA